MANEVLAATFAKPVDGATRYAAKHDQGKPDYTYLSRDFLEGMARVRAFGAKKYERDGWLKGFRIRQSLAAAFRHGWAFLWGEDNDPESGECHLFHMACSIEHAVNDYLHHPENDDRVKVSSNNQKGETKNGI